MVAASKKQETKNKKQEKSTSLVDKLFVTKFKPDFKSHISVNNDICRTCVGKECTKFCPSNVFTWNTEDEKLIIAYENCLECGACKSGCPYENVDFRNPNPGYGVNY